MGNSITSLKEISRLDFLSLFEEINGVEEILKSDPADVYSKMDHKTKGYYRNKIKEISEKIKISEIYIANKALELSIKNKQNEKQSHIGYYLVDNGINELIGNLGQKKKHEITDTKKSNIYIYSLYIITIFITMLIAIGISYKTKHLISALIFSIIIYIPISEIYIQIINYILNKSVKPKLIPKLDFSLGIPKEASTFVVIPTIITSKEKIKELIKKLEIYYLANKSNNIYFALLGDSSKSTNENEKFDDELIITGQEEVKKLNNKYGEKFYFLYRKRKWNSREKAYLGWERKRGLLNEFNNFMINGVGDFKANTINKIPKIKYIITLDSDTNLVLNSGLELIGAMAHILNKPQIDINKNIVIDGYGIIQPRIGVDLNSSNKSIFTKIYAGLRWYRFIYKCNI